LGPGTSRAENRKLHLVAMVTAIHKMTFFRKKLQITEKPQWQSGWILATAHHMTYCMAEIQNSLL